MNDPFNEFKFLTPTAIIINGREAVIKAETYQSSKERHLLEQGGDAAMLRYYSVTYAGENSSSLLNEVEVKRLIGNDKFLEF